MSNASKMWPNDIFEKFLESSLDLICIASTDGWLKHINPAFEDTLGFTSSELLSKPFLEFIHPDDVAETINKLADVGQGIKIRQFRNRYITKDGSVKYISWTATPSGQNGLLYAIGRDVTALLESESLLKQIQDALYENTIIASTDKQGKIESVNDKFCEISGYSREELIGKTHKIVNSGQHDKAFFKNLWGTISKGDAWSGLIENRKKTGEPYFVRSVIFPVFDLQEKIKNYLAIRFDITDFINLQNRLDRAYSVLNETSSIAKVGGWELDVASGDLTWTDETFNILEVEKNNNQKPTLPEGLSLFVDEHKPIIDEAVSRAIEFGEPYSLEIKALTAKGNVKWVFTNGKANYVNGKVVTLSGTIQDIQERKDTEARLELEQQKSIRQAKLASLGEMAAGVAHEINNPLTAIYGYAQLLLNSEKLNQNDVNKITNIYKSAERISHIVKSLKRFSSQNERRVYEIKDLSAIVVEAINLAEIKANRFGVLIRFIGDEHCFINCDEIEIEQVFINLINNAIDSVIGGEKRNIEIVLSKNDTNIFAEVIDYGNGIPENISERIFDPFFTTKTKKYGTGLGLSIVKGILNDHDADIIYERINDKTVFRITFMRQAHD